MADLSRRRFLALTGAAAGAAAVGVVGWRELVGEQVRDRAATPPAARPRDRVLVVLELAGGNDGLNTLVPADGHYRDARPTVAVREADLVALAGEDRYGLHPAVAGLAPLWAAGHLAALQGAGFPDQSRSHFVATDVWRAGGEAPFTRSWLGRWLDATAGDRPEPLRAVALGTDSRVLAADSLSTVVTSPAAFRLAAPSGPASDPEAVIAAFAATAAPRSDDPLLAAAQAVIPATIEGVDVLARAIGDVGPTQGVDPTPATTLLGTAAQLIGLEVGTQVVVVGVEGYDTHANQPERHRALLSDLTGGITAFLAAMADQGRADDVLVIATSEFGRRVAENGSAGTDHGDGNTLFALGPMVNGGVHGDLDLQDLVDGDVRSQIDARTLYANALDWLQAPTDDILNGRYDRLDLLQT